MRDQLYIALDLIGRFPPSIAFSAAEQIVTGVVPLIQKPDIVRQVLRLLNSRVWSDFDSLQFANRVDDYLLDIPWYRHTSRGGENYLPDRRRLRSRWTKTTGHNR